MVLTYVGIEGLSEVINRFRLNLAQMGLTYVGIDWHYKNSNSQPCSPRGTFQTNLPISIKFGTNGVEKLCY